MSYDLNGLELSEQINNTLSSYKYVAYCLTSRKYFPYTNRSNSRKFLMQHVGKGVDDVRDAAYIGQAFNKIYSRQQVETMVVDGTLKEICNDFIANLDIPVFEFEPEGYLIEDYLNDHKLVEEKQARCEDARTALVHVISKNKLQVPPMSEIKKFVTKVESAYADLNNWIKAAEAVMLPRVQ